MRNDYTQRPRPAFRGGGIAKRGLGAALRGGGVAKRGMGVALKDGGKADMAQDKKLIKKAFKMHDAQEHKGEHTKLDKLKKGGLSKFTPEEKYASKEAKVKKLSPRQLAKEEDKLHEKTETPEQEAREEAKMKKGGRVKKRYGGKC